MKTLVFETSLSGHRGYYVRVLAQELLYLGFEVCIALPETEFESVLFDIHMSPLGNDVQFLRLDTINPQRANSLWGIEFGLLRHAVSRIQPDHVYVPFADVIARQWGFPWNVNKKVHRNGNIEGLIMLSSGAYPALNTPSAVKSRLTDRAMQVRPWRRLHTLDPLSYDHMLRRGSESIRLLPEAIEPIAFTDKRVAREALGLPVDGTIVACPGGVQERKGADLLIDAVRSCKSPTTLALIGKHTSGMKRKIENDCSDLTCDRRLVSQDKYLTDAEFDQLFCAADIVAVPYPRHRGSASILIRAAAAGKKIVASEWGWVGWAATHFDLGPTCDVTDSAALGKLIQNASRETSEAASSDVRQQFLRYHTLENHLAHWTQFIRKFAGVAAGQLSPFPDPDAGAERRSGEVSSQRTAA